MALSLARPHFSEASRKQILDGIDDILTSGQLMLGRHNELLESRFAAYHGTQFAITTNSCTTALQMCLTHYGVEEREVLVPSAGFVTDVSVVRWAGGVPRLVDTDPHTLSFDLDDLKRKLTRRTRALIWVHLLGIISPAWKEIVAFAREHELLLIEDCAHAHGASVDGIKAGALGDVGCFSFYPTKVMTCGAGGALTTNGEALAKAARELRLFGRENGTGAVVREGNDWFLDEFRACVAYAQLQELDAFLARRREIASLYHRRLCEVPGLRLIEIPSANHPAWYQYSVYVESSVNYAALVFALRERHGVPTKQIYVPLHKEVIFRDLDDGSLQVSEDMLNRSLCLPIHAAMTNEEVEYVASALAAELSGHG